ncbi:hypothetical protein E2C01_066743 [Portunus trituberculatus]|uniref:Uncharacterized protein n=1 Tax=Portunus trituberculatus TaxID=210409 RepID=A0A5B7HUN7_PORTR|nr:hypothetical protein [Portunus trituberculatus]
MVTATTYRCRCTVTLLAGTFGLACDL